MCGHNGTSGVLSGKQLLVAEPKSATSSPTLMNAFVMSLVSPARLGLGGSSRAYCIVPVMVPITLATGWVWCGVCRESNHQAITTKANNANALRALD